MVRSKLIFGGAGAPFFSVLFGGSKTEWETGVTMVMDEDVSNVKSVQENSPHLFSDAHVQGQGREGEGAGP